MAIFNSQKNESAVIYRQPAYNLRKIIFGDGCICHITHMRRIIMRDGTIKVLIVCLPTKETKQMNNMTDDDLIEGRLHVTVDENSLQSLNDDPIFGTMFCINTIKNDPGPMSIIDYIKERDIKIKNLEKNLHVLQEEMGKKDMLLKDLARSFGGFESIATSVAEKVSQDLSTKFFSGMFGGRQQ